jgi:hypothetical protein
MEKHKNISRAVKVVCLGLPLAGAASSVLFPLRETARQLMILTVLLWVQFYFLFEVLLPPK